MEMVADLRVDVGCTREQPIEPDCVRGVELLHYLHDSRCERNPLPRESVAQEGVVAPRLPNHIAPYLAASQRPALFASGAHRHGRRDVVVVYGVVQVGQVGCRGVRPVCLVGVVYGFAKPHPGHVHGQGVFGIVGHPALRLPEALRRPELSSGAGGFLDFLEGHPLAAPLVDDLLVLPVELRELLLHLLRVRHRVEGCAVHVPAADVLLALVGAGRSHREADVVLRLVEPFGERDHAPRVVAGDGVGGLDVSWIQNSNAYRIATISHSVAGDDGIKSKGAREVKEAIVVAPVWEWAILREAGSVVALHADLVVAPLLEHGFVLWISRVEYVLHLQECRQNPARLPTVSCRIFLSIVFVEREPEAIVGQGFAEARELRSRPVVHRPHLVPRPPRRRVHHPLRGVHVPALDGVQVSPVLFRRHRELDAFEGALLLALGLRIRPGREGSGSLLPHLVGNFAGATHERTAPTLRGYTRGDLRAREEELSGVSSTLDDHLQIPDVSFGDFGASSSVDSIRVADILEGDEVLAPLREALHITLHQFDALLSQRDRDVAVDALSEVLPVAVPVQNRLYVQRAVGVAYVPHLPLAIHHHVGKRHEAAERRVRALQATSEVRPGAGIARATRKHNLLHVVGQLLVGQLLKPHLNIRAGLGNQLSDGYRVLPQAFKELVQLVL